MKIRGFGRLVVSALFSATAITNRLGGDSFNEDDNADPVGGRGS